MANDCWNKAIIRGDEAKLKILLQRFRSSENGVFNMTNYKNLFPTAVDLSYLDEEDWGSKRFTPESEIIDGELIITGDSAWSPMIGLFETICAEWGVSGQLEYDEMGYDFAGKIVWDENGDILENHEWTYWEKLFLYDKENFHNELEYQFDIYETFEEFLEHLNLSKWKDSSVLDLDELEKLFESKYNDD